ncbi:PilW family protein [Microbacterium hominis]|uniref:Prepilin-type N-terminal cleavage/methylation domain-containing protein n=1 Tax=Microbacterium hominis TaxID=162426 RepID=A0A7D4TNJ1_9MICO|nr:prepilin-type N-terminal cleavage/methylation domain-containing protein [Microbacterium hominis]QKJ19702.1 prepilin-type N-terminal cleavage/methylation domain-containing protein [Microbacterium hominis]
MTHSAHRDRDDAGLGLIELIVAIVVSGIVVGAIVMIFVNSWKTQEEVTSVSQATTRGQLIGSTIERAMRNAIEFEVSSGGTELRVRTTLDGSLRCQGFRLTADSARFTTSSGALTGDASAWPAWQTGIAARGTTAFFAAAGDTVTYTFDITTESAPVRFAGEASTRTPTTGVSSPCW